MSASSLRQGYFDILVEQIRGGRYPSPTMMDRLERTVGDRQHAEEYVQVLLDLVGQDRYPSPTMLDRIAKLIQILERAA